MSQQQTVLRVRTNRPSSITVTGTTGLSFVEATGAATGYTGTGTSTDPYVGTFGTGSSYIAFEAQCEGTIYWNCRLYNTTIGNNFFSIFKKHPEDAFTSNVFDSWSQFNVDYMDISTGDEIYFRQFGGGTITSGGTFNVYFQPDIQQVDYTIPTFDFLDLYDDIPITINKSFAEIEDISKRNSDYSLGVKLPGSKKNNRFFEDFFNVDSIGLYFDPLKKVPCNVLIDDESYFNGFMKLNSVSVKDSKIEYDITLFSSVGDLYGKIGTNLLKDLDFRDIDYFMNHYFTKDNVLSKWRYETLKSDKEVPSNFFYPVVHNGYNYNQSGSFTNVAFTGLTGTSLYTTTITGSWADTSTAYAAGADRYRINSPEDGVRDNQLKPSLSIYSILQIIFKQNGYKMGGSFKKIPWFKLLYLYGHFSDDNCKLSYITQPPQTYGLDGVELRWVLTTSGSTRTWNVYVVREGTGTPAYCSDSITGYLTLYDPGPGGGFDDYSFNIAPLTTGYTKTWGVTQFYSSSSANVAISSQPMSFLPGQVNQIVGIGEGDYVDFGQVIDNQIKQIDILSSIAKKFNLLFIPDEDNPYQINVEPYDYYVGTGNIYDWTDRLSYDKGFTVQPAQNFVESEIILTDKEDGDQGNKDYKDSNGIIYGYLKQTNPTDFKSQTKTIETTFSPEVIRVWNPLNNPDYPAGAVKIPLGINYTESSQEVGDAVDWIYKGVKTKPKIFFNLGNFNPFLATGTTVGLTGVTTNYFKVTEASGINSAGSLISPVISHTMPMGNPDDNKITNDSICVLFQSANVTSNPNEAIGTYNTYTDQDMYNLFYDNRITNIFNKETRFIDGYFNLSLSDIKNLKANDLIKINNQLFSWNSIMDFNLTNAELTKVQLLQYNSQYKTYPERYFQYYYCDQPSYIYKFKTDFSADTIYDSLYYWSILYDYFVGALGGGVSGYTSSIKFGSGLSPYIPYYINETTEDTYNTSGAIDWNYDPQRFYFLAQLEEEPVDTIFNQQNDVFLINSGNTLGRLNVFTSCSGFTAAATSLGVLTSGSTIPTLPTPTPTPIPVTPTPTPIGLNVDSRTVNLSVSKTDYYDNLTPDYSYVMLNGFRYSEIDNLYRYTFTDSTTFTMIAIASITLGVERAAVNIYQKYYSQDNENGDNGIVRELIYSSSTNTLIPGRGYGVSISGLDLPDVTPPSGLSNSVYRFEFDVEVLFYADIPTPTPTVTPTLTVTPTPTLTVTPTVTPSASPLPPFIFDVFAGSGSGAFTLQLPYYPDGVYDGIIDWGDGNTSVNSYANRIHTYSAGVDRDHTITITGKISKWSFLYDSSSKASITNIRQWGSLQFLNNDGGYFYLCGALTLLATDAPNFNGVTNLQNMFAGCPMAFSGDCSNWNVSNITNMSGMFSLQTISGFNGDISSWNVSNVTTMQSMFNSNYAFNRNISSWNVSNVTNMAGMFLSAQSFNQNISSWNVSNVTTMQGMFNSAQSFNQNISSWSVNNVTNMIEMFKNATVFNQDLTNWCAINIPSEPFDFATGASSWVLPRPNWGCVTPTPTPTKTVTPTPTLTPTTTLPGFYTYVYLTGGTPSINQFTLTNTTIVITECDQYSKCYTFNNLTNGSTIDIYNTQLGNIYYGRFTLSSAPTYSSGRYTITGAYVGSPLETTPGLFSNNLYFSVVGATPTPTPTATITPTKTPTPTPTG